MYIYLGTLKYTYDKIVSQNLRLLQGKIEMSDKEGKMASLQSE